MLRSTMQRKLNQKSMVMNPRQNSRKLQMTSTKVGSKSHNRDQGGTKIPKIFAFQPLHEVRRRYIATAAANGIWNIQSGNLQFMAATTTILLNCIAECWRVKSVEAWSSFNTSTALNGHISLSAIAQDTSSNAFNSDPWQLEDTSPTIDRPAHVFKKMSKGTPEGDFHYGSTTNTGGALFGLVCTVGTVIDIVFQVRYAFGANGASFAQFTQACVAANVGTLYARVPMTNITPQDVNVI